MKFGNLELFQIVHASIKSAKPYTNTGGIYLTQIIIENNMGRYTGCPLILAQAQVLQRAPKIGKHKISISI